MSIIGGGNDSILSRLLSDPEALKDEFRRLQKATDDADAKIALAGEASKITSMREDAKRALETATVTLDNAQKQAASLLSDATTKAETILSNAKKDAYEARSTADALLQDAKGKLSAAEDQVASFQSMKAEQDAMVRDATEKADSVRANAERREAEAIAEREKLTAIRTKLEDIAERLKREIND